MSQPANDEFSQHLSDEESNHEEASDTGDAPKQQQQVIPQTTAISNIKLPILKKEEYDIWAMEMEHYLEYIDNEVWKVIQNGNSKKRISTGKDGIVRVLSPVTAAEIQAVEKERKAKNILLMAIPKEHMRRFHGMDDAKEIKGVRKGIDIFSTATFLNWKLMVMKYPLKNAIIIFSDLCPSMFLRQEIQDTYIHSTPSTSSTNILEKEVLTGFADEVIYSLFAKQSEDWDLLHEDLEQINDVDIEEMDINWQIAMIAIRMKKFYKKTSVRHALNGDYTPKPQEEIDDSLYVYGKKGPQKPEISVTDDNSSEHSTCQSNDSEGSCGNTFEHSFETESERLDEPNEMSKSRLEVTNEKDVSAPESKEVEPSCVSHIKSPRQPLKDKETHKVNRKNWNDMMEIELGEGYSLQRRNCFVCGILKSHLIKDCNYYEKNKAREAEVKRVVNTGNGMAKPVWTNANRVNHSNKFVPRPVQLNAGRPNINSVRPNINTGMTNINSVRPRVNAVGSNANTEHLLKNMVDRGIFDSGCSGHMTGNKDQLEDFEEFNRGSVTFGGSKGYISGKGKIRVGNLDFDSVSFVKELGHFNLFSISQICDKQHKVLFTETECLVVSSDFKMPDENQILLKVPRHHNMYSFDMKTPTPAKGFACLIAKATSDESKLWHRRLGHINFKNLNKLVKGNLVRGLPSKVFKNDHTCVACHKGKQHRASCKAKLERLITEPLHTLHMDLFGPTSVKSINHASYCLVITDDCTRFSWVFFLASKDETSGILQTFIRQIENQLSHRVKIIRSDNGTEFKNRDMLEFCGNKGIKQEYSNARTPQQNGVAERMNRTLIEAARTMLADSLLPTTFWAEAVSTACYIFNRVRVTKPQNKTPYELLFGHKPIISYIRPFGCHVTILDTLSVLGKFDGKSDEGFLVGYSLNSKAYRVYNLVTKRVEVNLHVNFLEDKPNVKGVGYRWMFDIDYLTDSMNYIPVSLENQANPHAGASEVTNSAGTSQTPKSIASEEKDEEVELIVVPTAIKFPEEKDESRTSSINSKKEETLTEPQQEKKDSSTKSLEDNPKIHAFRRELEEIALKHLGKVPKNNTTSTPSVNTGSHTVNTGRLDHDDSLMPELEIFHKPETGIFEEASYDEEGVITDFNSLPTEIEVSPTPTLRIHSIHPKSQILGDPKSAVQTRSKVQNKSGAHALLSHIHKQQRNNHKDQQHCLFACFLSQEEPKKIAEALQDDSWVQAMQEELLQFKLQQVWVLVDLPHGMKVIGTKWVYRNKRDERGVVVRNKARLVAQGYTQEEGIDYDEVFAPVARIEAIRLFLAFASFMGFIVYQMDVKSAFLYGTIDEESWCDEFEALMKSRFQMSSMGELTFFFGLQVKQNKEGIFISQDKYVAEILKKFDLIHDRLMVGQTLDKKSQQVVQFLVKDLFMAMQETVIVVTSTTKSEYVAAAIVVEKYKEAPSVTQPQPSSSVVPPTPPTTQHIPSDSTTIHLYLNCINLQFTCTLNNETYSLKQPSSGNNNLRQEAILTLWNESRLWGCLRDDKRVLLSDSEEEETEARGRKFHDLDPLVSLLQELITPSKTPSKTVNASGEEQSVDKGKRYKRRKVSKESAGAGLDFEEVKSAFEEVNTGSIKVSTEVDMRRKGSYDREETQASKKQRQFFKKKRDLLKPSAQRMAEEQELTEEQKKRKAQVQFKYNTNFAIDLY
ncbi:putative ribonuclease H-like domain-containing protein [Tanacetum coccineum]